MVKINASCFCLDQICQSGQCFRMEKLKEGEFCLTAFSRQLHMAQTGTEISFDCSQEEFDVIWKSYFDLEEDYDRVLNSIDKEDGYLQKAAAYGSGIRILRQDLWETLISFIISQQNNIVRIRKCIRLLCERYGERGQAGDGSSFYAFPTPERLANATLEELNACNLGYRSRYVKETAAAVSEGKAEFERIGTMNYEQAKEALMKFRGVGKKVAECVCLFALHQTDAFPIDTHISKVLKQQYPKGFPSERYSGYNGILQQYIFYYDLEYEIK